MANNDYKWWWDFTSRKFLVLAVATAMLWFGKVSDDVWLYVALAYIGVNVVQKYIDSRVPKETNGVGVGPGEKL